MVSRGRHPKSPIADALDGLDTKKFEVVEIHIKHRWGKLVCLQCGSDLAISGTPRVPEHVASTIRRFAKQHHSEHERSTE